MKKKLLSALLVATCVVSMAACGSNKTEKEAKDDKIMSEQRLVLHHTST